MQGGLAVPPSRVAPVLFGRREIPLTTPCSEFPGRDVSQSGGSRIGHPHPAGTDGVLPLLALHAEREPGLARVYPHLPCPLSLLGTRDIIFVVISEQPQERKGQCLVVDWLLSGVPVPAFLGTRFEPRFVSLVAMSRVPITPPLPVWQWCRWSRRLWFFSARIQLR